MLRAKLKTKSSVHRCLGKGEKFKGPGVEMKGLKIVELLDIQQYSTVGYESDRRAYGG